MSADIEIQNLIQELSSKTSPKRRSAAKKLRKLKANEAGPALLTALENELKDKRTWETQYQIIMALGESGHTEALPFLNALSGTYFEATMVSIGIGDAITTLENAKNNSLTSLQKWIKDNKRFLAEGGIRSLAVNKIIPSEVLILQVIEYARKPGNENMDFWVAAASPSWPANLTRGFLVDCLRNSSLADTKKAAKAALEGRRLKWKPL